MSSINFTSSSSTTGTSYSKGSTNSRSSSSTTGTSYTSGSINSRPSSSTSGTSYTTGLINSRSSSSTTMSSSTSSTASSRSFSCNDIMPGNSFNRIFPNNTADSRITGSHQTMTGIHYLGAFLTYKLLRFCKHLKIGHQFASFVRGVYSHFP